MCGIYVAAHKLAKQWFSSIAKNLKKIKPKHISSLSMIPGIHERLKIIESTDSFDENLQCLDKLSRFLSIVVARKKSCSTFVANTKFPFPYLADNRAVFEIWSYMYALTCCLFVTETSDFGSVLFFTSCITKPYLYSLCCQNNSYYFIFQWWRASSFF